MGTEIIADKFALLKSKGSNGVAFTQVVEDTLLGQRAVVKVSDRLGLLTLDYLKNVNLAREMDIPGLLLPFEGGILEDEEGYYLASDELGEPSLENYLRIGIPVTCEEALKILERVLATLEAMHGAGFCHLFVETRNIFYRGRERVTLKDPALKAHFFHPLLELVEAPDFSYLSPEVMDGQVPGEAADVYAVGRLAERLLEEAADVATSPLAPVLRWLAGECRREGAGEQVSSAGDVRKVMLERAAAAAAVGGRSDAGSSGRAAAGSGIGAGTGALRIAGAAHGDFRVRTAADGDLEAWTPAVSAGRGRAAATLARFFLPPAAVIVLALAAILFMNLRGGAGEGPVVSAAGGSAAARELASARAEEVSGSHEEVGREEVTALAAARGEENAVPGAGEELPATIEAAAENGSGMPSAGPAPAPQQEDRKDPGGVAERSPAPPVASFTISPSQGESPLQVYLDASSSYDPDGAIVSYSWSCGGQGVSLYRVFESSVIPATLSVTLTVTDDGGHSSSATRRITLY